METGERLSSFSFDSTPIPHVHVKQSFLPPTCFLGCQTPLPSEVVELSFFCDFVLCLTVLQERGFCR